MDVAPKNFFRDVSYHTMIIDISQPSGNDWGESEVFVWKNNSILQNCLKQCLDFKKIFQVFQTKDQRGDKSINRNIFVANVWLDRNYS